MKPDIFYFTCWPQLNNNLHFSRFRLQCFAEMRWSVVGDTVSLQSLTGSQQKPFFRRQIGCDESGCLPHSVFPTGSPDFCTIYLSPTFISSSTPQPRKPSPLSPIRPLINSIKWRRGSIKWFIKWCCLAFLLHLTNIFTTQHSWEKKSLSPSAFFVPRFRTDVTLN